MSIFGFSKKSYRPLVWLSSCRTVIWGDTLAAGSQSSTVSERDSLCSWTSSRISVARNVLETLPIENAVPATTLTRWPTSA